MDKQLDLETKSTKKNSEPNITALIITLLGTKGGIGKTTTACHLANWHIHHNQVTPKLLDLDPTNLSFTRFFKNDEIKPQLIDIRKFRQLDDIVEMAESADHPVIIADQRAATDDEMFNWFKDVPFEDLSQAGIRFTGVASITSSPDSVSVFLNWVNELQDNINYLIVRNEKDGTDFTAWERTQEAVDFRNTYKPKTVVIPELKDGIAAELDIRNLTIQHVLDSKVKIDGFTTTLMRSRLRRYQSAIFAQFDEASELLLP